MSENWKAEARKQYVHYFRIWFIVVGVLLGIAIITGAAHYVKVSRPRTNEAAPTERVYDYADVLSDEEEESLRQHIAEMEKKTRMDIVLVTFNQSVEGAEAQQQYGYRSADWELNMRDIADDFWDENQYGYNKGFEGDGCILVHNWYEGQNGEHLSTSGKVEEAFSVADIDDVLYQVDKYYDTNPYQAYMAYVDRASEIMLEEENGFSFSFVTAVLVPLLIAGIYASANLHQKQAEDTTTASTYVAGGKPVVKEKSDDFIRKSVSTVRIQTSSSSSSSGGSSGGGGHHTSSSGASHGGGSHRH